MISIWVILFDLDYLRVALHIDDQLPCLCIQRLSFESSPWRLRPNQMCISRLFGLLLSILHEYVQKYVGYCCKAIVADCNKYNFSYADIIILTMNLTVNVSYLNEWFIQSFMKITFFLKSTILLFSVLVFMYFLSNNIYHLEVNKHGGHIYEQNVFLSSNKKTYFI